MSREMEDRIAATAARQHGVVARAQLTEEGLSRWAIDRRVKAGRLRRVHRGVYLVGPLEPPWAREMAAVLAGGPTALLSHLSAAALWDITPGGSRAGPGAPPGATPGATPGASPAAAREPVHITIEGKRRRNRSGIRVHYVHRLDPAERTVRHGVPVTAPERTLVDAASMTGAQRLERMVARAERKELVDREELASLVSRYPSRAGMAMLRTVLALPGGAAFTRSEAEARFLALVRDAGLPPPKTNVKLGLYEIDFLWPARGIAVEVDGFRYHASRPRFEGDRQKDAWLLAQGIKVIRLSWRQIVDRGTATAVQVGQALAVAVTAGTSRSPSGR